MATSGDRAWAGVALLATGLLCLVLGDWVTLSEHEAPRGNVPLAVLAAVFVGFAVAVTVRFPRSRRILGGALAALVGVLVLAGFREGFRFVWETGEPRLFVFLLAVSLLALLLLSPGSGVSPYRADDEGVGRDMPMYSRISLWVVTALVAAVIGFNAGVTQYERTRCRGAEVSECEVAVLGGVVGVGIALALVAVALVVVVVLRRRRREG